MSIWASISTTDRISDLDQNLLKHKATTMSTLSAERSSNAQFESPNYERSLSGFHLSYLATAANFRFPPLADLLFLISKDRKGLILLKNPEV